MPFRLVTKVGTRIWTILSLKYTVRKAVFKCKLKVVLNLRTPGIQGSVANVLRTRRWFSRTSLSFCTCANSCCILCSSTSIWLSCNTSTILVTFCFYDHSFLWNRTALCEVSDFSVRRSSSSASSRSLSFWWFGKRSSLVSSLWFLSDGCRKRKKGLKKLSWNRKSNLESLYVYFLVAFFSGRFKNAEFLHHFIY